MSDVLIKMLSQLSEEDKVIFDSLAQKLKTVNGDVSLLSEDDLTLIKNMEEKYGDKIRDSQNADSLNSSSTESVLDTPFAEQVRQILARDLVNKFPIEADAVNFVFENKWLPIDCQNEELVADLFEKFKQDIILCNQWRNDLVTVEEDIKMAVGLAWFMVIYQLQQRLQ